jgi:limonene-1,2-epoxide hydrolase
MKDPETLVRDFCAAWPERDVEKLLGYSPTTRPTTTCRWSPVTGKNGIREVLNLFIPAEDVEAEITHLAVRGNIVFTERIDRMTFAGKKVVLPSAGVFEIRDGKIAA